MERLQIEDVAFGGKGVARSGGKVIFIPFTIAGEEVTVQVVKQKKTFAEAELQSVETPSPHRVAPRCPYFGTCGGCSYQHIDYAEQLALKSRQVGQTLRRVGGLREIPLRPIVASPKPYGYRNRIRVHVRDGALGFFGHDTQRLIDIERCPIASDEVNDALRKMRGAHPADGHYTINEPGRPRFFEQINDEVARALIASVRDLVNRDHTTLIDAYSGAGFFSKGLADLFKQVMGIETNARAVEHARRSASDNEKYLVGDVAEHLADLLPRHDSEKTTLVLDPPAIGIPARVSDLILTSMPREIIYVSCDPATLARDLKILCRTYRLASVTPLDMFPQTAEIEVIAHLKPPT